MTHLHSTTRPPLRQSALPELELECGKLSDVRLLGTSKMGTTSWQGRVGRQPVKIYRCTSSAQAELLIWASKHSQLGAYFPDCVERQGALLIVEWVDGRVLDKRTYRKQVHLIEATADLLAKLHTAPLPAGLVVEDLYRAYLIRRWKQHAGKLFQEVHDGLVELLETGPRSPIALTHPDLAPQNLVLESGGALCSIDNELMAASSLPWIDLFNPWRYFGRGFRARRNIKRYLMTYEAAGGRLESLATHADAIQALWNLRRIGSFLEDGRLAEAEALGRQILQERAPDHPLVIATRRLVS